MTFKFSCRTYLASGSAFLQRAFSLPHCILVAAPEGRTVAKSSADGDMGGRSRSPPPQQLSPQQRQVLGLQLFLGTCGVPRVSRRCSFSLSELAAGIWELSNEQCDFFLLTRRRLEPVVFFLSQLPATTRHGFVITQCSLAGCNVLCVGHSLVAGCLSLTESSERLPK